MQHDLAGRVAAGDLTDVADWLAATPPHEVAAELVRLPSQDRAVAFRLLARDAALAVFESLAPAHQQELLDSLREDAARQLVESMDPDDRVRLLDELPASVARRILAGLSPHEREITAALLGYPERSAGRIMNPEFVRLRPHERVVDALDRVRRQAVDAETVEALPVTDDELRLVGMVGLRDLVLAPDDTPVRDLMSSSAARVHVDADQELAARLMQDANLLVLPVLDSEDRIVGVITVDDAMRILEEEVTEDVARLGGAEPVLRPYPSATVRYLARRRFAWLLLLIVAAALTVNVLSFFEADLERLVTLALFIPLLVDTGGNSGSQAATTVVRALALDELRTRDVRMVAWKEARVGILLGAMLAAGALLPVWALFGRDIAVVVSLSLVAICAWASIIGSLMPLLAAALRIDPAVMSAPVVTTLVDATGLLIYFSIARIIV